jgi:hypothetical protein
MKDFEQFVLVIQNRPSISEEEWVQFDKQFSELSEVRYRKYEKEFTEEEFQKIEEWRNNYQYRRLGASLKNNIKVGLHKLKEVYEGFSK